jgi:DNA-binding transcriptional MocR family regulator
LVAAVVAGQHDAIVKWRAEWTRSRYDAVAAALRSFLPAWDWAPPSGGLTIWARLPGAGAAGGGAACGGPGSPDSSAFAQAALRRGVAVVPGRLLSAAGGGRSHLRLAFTSSPERLTAAVMALASV